LFAIEGVNCLCDAGKYQEALGVIDRIGKTADTVGRIHAAESAGDLPTGRDAETEALRLAKIFLESNEFGLYRGEVLFELGNHHLECRHDVKAAIASYVKSKAWCEAAFKLDKDLNLFSVPGQSASVSAPPKAMKQKDAWGNIDWAVPAPGKLFNRRTAKWYLGHLRIMAGTKLALAYFLDGRKTSARTIPQLTTRRRRPC